jgi:hypothetical protein
MTPARLASRIRLPWSAHVWALALLVPLSVGLAVKVFIADPGPYGNWITYHRVRALNAAEIAGRQPPKYRVSFTTPADRPRSSKQTNPVTYPIFAIWSMTFRRCRGTWAPSLVATLCLAW